MSSMPALPDAANSSPKLAEMQVAECAEAMIDRHDHDVALAAQVGAVVPRRIAGARDERAAMAPEHDRALAPVIDRRRPDVEHEAVLAHRRQRASREQLDQRGIEAECVVVLHRAIAEFERVAHAGPRLELSRRPEATVTFGRFSIRDAFENVDARCRRSREFFRNWFQHLRVAPSVEYLLDPQSRGATFFDAARTAAKSVGCSS